MALSKIIPIVFIFFVISIYFGGYNAGYNVSDNKFKEYKIKQLELLKAQRDQYDKLYQEKLSLIKELDLANVKNKEQINNTKLAVDAALADRLRREKNRAVKCPVSKDTGTSSGSNDSRATDRSIVLSEELAKGLGERQKYADELTESLRECREYVSILKNNERKIKF